jgi:hypothetical protein
MKAGESFFVPSLDPKVTMLEGRRAAQGRRVISFEAIFDGKLGVMFKLRR